MDCVFCNIEEFVLENHSAVAIFDKYPKEEGHMLIIPKKHITTFFAVSEDERNEIFYLIEECKEYLDAQFTPTGYNIVINHGESAGQTIDHLHIHLIPRYGNAEGEEAM